MQQVSVEMSVCPCFTESTGICNKITRQEVITVCLSYLKDHMKPDILYRLEFELRLRGNKRSACYPATERYL